MALLFNVSCEKTKQFTITIPESMIEQIARRSVAQSLSKSAYVRLALLEQFRKEDK